MRGPTLLFAPTKTYCPVSVNLREKWNPFFSSLSPLFVSPFFFFPPLFFLFIFSFLPYPLALPSFISSPNFFSFSLYFLFPFLSFSLLFLFIFLFFSSLFASPTHIDQKWGKLPSTILSCHLSSQQFSLFFFLSLSYT